MAANAAAEVAARLRAIRARAASDAPLAAVRALSQAGETAVKVTLTSSTHSRGTPTPSRPGQPPSLVTGTLRRSAQRAPARLLGPGSAACLLGVTALYAPVHEFGPVTIRARRHPVLGRPDAGFFGPQVTIPRRPYMEPAMRKLADSGMAARVCETAWRASLGI